MFLEGRLMAGERAVSVFIAKAARNLKGEEC